MENKYFYSPSNGGFYQSQVHNIIPDDALEITKEEYKNLLEGNAKGKAIISGGDGIPELADPAPPTAEQYIAVAEAEKSRKLESATVKINPLQDAVDLEIATDAEKLQLTAWKKYRVSVNRVDTLKAPDIDWPDSPR